MISNIINELLTTPYLSFKNSKKLIDFKNSKDPDNLHYINYIKLYLYTYYNYSDDDTISDLLYVHKYTSCELFKDCEELYKIKKFNEKSHTMTDNEILNYSDINVNYKISFLLNVRRRVDLFECKYPIDSLYKYRKNFIDDVFYEIFTSFRLFDNNFDEWLDIKKISDKLENILVQDPLFTELYSITEQEQSITVRIIIRLIIYNIFFTIRSKMLSSMITLNKNFLNFFDIFLYNYFEKYILGNEWLKNYKSFYMNYLLLKSEEEYESYLISTYTIYDYKNRFNDVLKAYLNKNMYIECLELCRTNMNLVKNITLHYNGAKLISSFLVKTKNICMKKKDSMYMLYLHIYTITYNNLNKIRKYRRFLLFLNDTFTDKQCYICFDNIIKYEYYLTCSQCHNTISHIYCSIKYGKCGTCKRNIYLSDLMKINTCVDDYKSNYLFSELELRKK